MRNFWMWSFLAVMYLFFSWAAEAFAADLGHKTLNLEEEKFLKTKKKPIIPLWKSEKHVEPKRVKRQAEGESFLNTISLSYAGDYQFSETIAQGRELLGALASALGSMVDMRLVRSVVDNVVERLNGRYTVERKGRSDLSSIEGDRNRSDLPEGASDQDPSQERLKEGITTLVGAALGEQECWERTACLAGEYASQIPGKDVLFLVLDRFAPNTWVPTVNTFKQSATYIQDCAKFICTTEIATNPRHTY